MNDKDNVNKAALRALRGEQDKQDKSGKKASAFEKSSAKAATPQSKSKTAAKKKTTASSASQKAANPVSAPPDISMAQTPGNSNEIGGLGFLALALLIPLAFVAGPYGYIYFYKDKNPTSSAKTIAQVPKTKSASNNESARKSANPIAASQTGLTGQAGQTDISLKGASKTAQLPQSGPDAISSTQSVTTAAKTDLHKSKWGYDKPDWALVDPAYKTCGHGKSQSPINIPASGGHRGPNFAFNYFPQSGKVHNNGHTIQVDLDAKSNGGSQLLVNGSPYDLIQFHFHTPSENQLNGKSYPMEMQLVHKNAQNQLAIVAVMLTAGGFNQLLDNMPLPAKPGDSHNSGEASINPFNLLPAIRNYATFSGSLTTPPCSENVGWIVMQQPLTISKPTLAKFQKILGKNNRPLQALNGRTIYTNY